MLWPALSGHWGLAGAPAGGAVPGFRLAGVLNSRREISFFIATLYQWFYKLEFLVMFDFNRLGSCFVGLSIFSLTKGLL